MRTLGSLLRINPTAKAVVAAAVGSASVPSLIETARFDHTVDWYSHGRNCAASFQIGCMSSSLSHFGDWRNSSCIETILMDPLWSFGYQREQVSWFGRMLPDLCSVRLVCEFAHFGTLNQICLSSLFKNVTSLELYFFEWIADLALFNSSFREHMRSSLVSSRSLGEEGCWQRSASSAPCSRTCCLAACCFDWISKQFCRRFMILLMVIDYGPLCLIWCQIQFNL